MPTAKARYVGDGAGKKLADFSDALRKKLRQHYPRQHIDIHPEFDHQSDCFVEAVLSSASNAAADIMWLESDLTMQELRAERKDILASLEVIHKKLRTLSPPFLNLLPDGAIPLEVADILKNLIDQISDTAGTIDEMPRNPRPDEARHAIAVDMTICVSRVLKEYSVPVTATYGTYEKMNDITSNKYDGTDVNQYKSVGIEILKAIGDDIGLVLSEVTWRDVIIKAKKIAPEIR